MMGPSSRVGREVMLVPLVVACGRAGFDPLADATARTCDGVHAFCDDFDRTGSVRGPWLDFNTGAGEMVLDTAAASSPPQSLLIDLAFPATPGQVATLSTLMPGGTTGVRLSFDLALSQTDTTGECDLVSLAWQVAPTDCTGFAMIFVRSTAGVVAMQETYVDCGGVYYNDLPSVDTGLHHYELVIDYVTDRILVRRDGVAVLDKQALHEIPVGDHRLTIGASVITPLALGWQLRYDDVVVDRD